MILYCSAMEVVLIAAAGLCLLFLLAACYRWCALVNRVRASRQDGIVCKFNCYCALQLYRLRNVPSFLSQTL
jgi:hypothetical protein